MNTLFDRPEMYCCMAPSGTDAQDMDMCEGLSLDTPAESSPSTNVTGSTKRGSGEAQNQSSNHEEGKKANTYGDEGGESTLSSDQAVDFTLVPQILDTSVEEKGEGNALRSTTIKTGDDWTRNMQENLLTRPEKQTLNTEEIKKEKNKAFDLLDARSRSGSLPIAYSELHVIVAVTHCFDKDVMSTVVCDNVNPIEQLECSTLLLASTVHGVPARELI